MPCWLTNRTKSRHQRNNKQWINWNCARNCGHCGIALYTSARILEVLYTIAWNLPQFQRSRHLQYGLQFRSLDHDHISYQTLWSQRQICRRLQTSRDLAVLIVNEEHQCKQQAENMQWGLLSLVIQEQIQQMIACWIYFCTSSMLQSNLQRTQLEDNHQN